MASVASMSWRCVRASLVIWSSSSSAQWSDLPALEKASRRSCTVSFMITHTLLKVSISVRMCGSSIAFEAVVIENVQV